MLPWSAARMSGTAFAISGTDTATACFDMVRDSFYDSWFVDSHGGGI
jgi:hypothetical protein